MIKLDFSARHSRARAGTNKSKQRVSITARFGRIQMYKGGHAMNLKNLPNPAKTPGFSGFLGF
jgi:hypothetical protein